MEPTKRRKKDHMYFRVILKMQFGLKVTLLSRLSITAFSWRPLWFAHP